MNDTSVLTLDLSYITERIVPISVRIDWGDGSIENFDKNSSNNDIINIFKFSPLLLNTYTHQYYPSESCLYKCLSAQILITYCNGDYSWFILPLKIRTYDYFESIRDIKLINTNILPNDDNSKEHQLLTSLNRYTIELIG
jgi:hypothetical protein